MNIKRLQIENFLRVSVVDIRPDGNVIYITGKNTHGKQQPVSEPVLTPLGWKPIGKIKTGDFVIGSDGNPTEVLGVYPQTEHSTFLVKMSKGGSTRCGPEHLWTVSRWSHSKSKGNNRIVETMTTIELLKHGIKINNGDSRRFSIEAISGPVQFADSGMELPIEPYTLGVILGDGHIEKTGYTTITSWDEEIFDTLNVKGWRNEHELGTGAWSRPLKHLGLAGKKAQDKFIPTEYLMASSKDRASLLAGLLDTDGYAPSSWAEFSSTSDQLAGGVLSLGLSLGFVCNKRYKNKVVYKYKDELKEGRPVWNVLIKSPESPFRLVRKTEKWSPSKQRGSLRHFIDSIEQVKDEDSVCIKVANKDGLYVTKDFILTHNTSVLNAIWAGLANPRFSEFPKPVKDGEEKAIITIDLDQYVITRIFTDIGGDTKTTLKVEGAEGAVFLKPQKFLDKLLGALTFDPLAFIDMKEKPQVEMLLKLAGGEIDIEAMDIARGNAYDQRTTANQTVSTLSAARGEEPEKLEKIDLSIIQNQMEKSSDLRNNIQVQEKRYQNIKDQLDQLIEQETSVTEYLEKARKTVGTYKPYDELKADIEKGIEHNTKVGDWEKWNQAGEDLKLYSDKANEYTNVINDIDARKKDAIAALEFPYPGLSFGASGVVFNNIPLKQASKAEQIRISMAIAMAMNPKLRVLRIEDGSLLDEDNLKLIHKLAEEHDYQVWVERVKGDGKGILIEDGTVKDAA